MNNAQVAQDDLRQIMRELGISTHARPYSPHEVVQREVLPRLKWLMDMNYPGPRDDKGYPLPFAAATTPQPSVVEELDEILAQPDDKLLFPRWLLQSMRNGLDR